MGPPPNVSFGVHGNFDWLSKCWYGLTIWSQTGFQKVTFGTCGNLPNVNFGLLDAFGQLLKSYSLGARWHGCLGTPKIPQKFPWLERPTQRLPKRHQMLATSFQKSKNWSRCYPKAPNTRNVGPQVPAKSKSCSRSYPQVPELQKLDDGFRQNSGWGVPAPRENPPKSYPKPSKT